MNKKGFTLVELLAVVVIMGILALIVIPNVTRIIERGKKEQYISDAKGIISKAKYEFKLSERELSSCSKETAYSENATQCNVAIYFFNDLGIEGKLDPYDEEYYSNGGVIVFNIEGEYKYLIILRAKTHALAIDEDHEQFIGKDTWIFEEALDDAYIKTLE